MKNMNQISSIVCSVAMGLAITGCGGGSSSDVGTNVSATDDSKSNMVSTFDSTCGFAQFQAEMLVKINAYRTTGAVCGGTVFPSASAVSWNGQLQAAATVMAADIAKTGSHSHIGSDGSTFGSRISAAGYGYVYAGENISGGYGSVQAAVDGWMASQIHCENIMKAEFREIGASCVRNGAGETNFALEFGAR